MLSPSPRQSRFRSYFVPEAFLVLGLAAVVFRAAGFFAREEVGGCFFCGLREVAVLAFPVVRDLAFVAPPDALFAGAFDLRAAGVEGFFLALGLGLAAGLVARDAGFLAVLGFLLFAEEREVPDFF